MGGDCLNYGCVPSKALIAAARRAQAMREASRFGISDAEPQIDFRRINRHVRSVDRRHRAERFRRAASRRSGVRVIAARRSFSDRRTVMAGDHEIRARRFVVATGSSPLIPPIEGLDETGFLTNETIFEHDPQARPSDRRRRWTESGWSWRRRTGGSAAK